MRQERLHTDVVDKANPFERGADFADESTATTVPPRAAWVGRVQSPLDGGRVLLVTHTDYEWAARPETLREATVAERAAYDAARTRWLRTPILGVRP